MRLLLLPLQHCIQCIFGLGVAGGERERVITYVPWPSSSSILQDMNANIGNNNLQCNKGTRSDTAVYETPLQAFPPPRTAHERIIGLERDTRIVLKGREIKLDI